ncbi:MAG: YraN family protein [Acidobacteriota bacterium]|nr:YraN family protein [Acidobacteriota bacterium]
MRSLRGFSTALSTRARGQVAEDAAQKWLCRQGFVIVTVNYSTKPGEIDVIATEGDTLCFIEVKARQGSRFGYAAEAVSPRKQQRLCNAASLFLASTDWQGPCRFDVLAIDKSDRRWSFVLVRDAFRVPEAR